MPRSITVTYRLTPARLAEFSGQLGKKVTGMSSTGWLLLTWGLLCLPVRAGLEKIMPDSSKGVQLAASALLLFPPIAYWYRRSRKSFTALPEQDITLIFTEDGVEKRSLHAESRQTWQAFEKRMETDKHYFLYYPNRTADVVPKDAFASPEDAAAFKQLIEGKLPSSSDPHPILGRTRKGFYIAFIAVMVLLVASVKWLGPAIEHQTEVTPSFLIGEMKTIASAQELFRTRFALNGKPAYWRDDVAGLYAYNADGKEIQLIDRQTAAADADPVERKFQEASRFGYLLRSLHFGKENFSDPDRWAIAFFPARNQAAKPTFIMDQSGTVWSKALGPSPKLYQFPADPAAEGWSKVP